MLDIGQMHPEDFWNLENPMHAASEELSSQNFGSNHIIFQPRYELVEIPGKNHCEASAEIDREAAVEDRLPPAGLEYEVHRKAENIGCQQHQTLVFRPARQ